MRHLYQKIYLTIIVALLLAVAIPGLIWRFGSGGPGDAQTFEVAGELIAGALAPPEAPPAEQAQALDRLSQRLKLDLALLDEARRLVAAAGKPLPMPSVYRRTPGWIYGPGGPGWLIQLPDDRWLIARVPPRRRHPALGLVLFLGLIAAAIAASAYPVVRGLTRRLERLQTGVETLGSGDLSARVKVEGKDEIARLASSFNAAAGKIENLVGAHRMLLANASHELRTPLSRLRLGIELLKDTADPKRRAELEQDIAELDRLIDEILLASRLDAARDLDACEHIDLLALAAEECARTAGCELDGKPVAVSGDPHLLRRLLRNLLENAYRHGKPPVEVRIDRNGQSAVIEVSDAGDGIPPGERERVFEPFHRLPAARQGTGTGLGLSLVRQIARRHGGDATVVGAAGGGSFFRVTLPAV